MGSLYSSRFFYIECLSRVFVNNFHCQLIEFGGFLCVLHCALGLDVGFLMRSRIAMVNANSVIMLRVRDLGRSIYFYVANYEKNHQNFSICVEWGSNR
jgi:hypothetical protein